MRALVLSGGGGKGSFQLGVLEQLALCGEEFDVIYGTSVGALNAAGICMFPVGELVQAVEFLKYVWLQEIKGRKSIFDYKLWPFGNGFVSTKPLAQLLSKVTNIAQLRASGRGLRVNAVSCPDGEHRIWDQNTPDIEAAVMASAAFPYIFPKINYQGKTWIDGGVYSDALIEQAVVDGATSITAIICTGPKDPTEHPVYEIIRQLTCNAFAGAIENDFSCVPSEINLRVLKATEPIGASLDFNPTKNLERYLHGLSISIPNL